MVEDAVRGEWQIRPSRETSGEPHPESVQRHGLQNRWMVDHIKSQSDMV